MAMTRLRSPSTSQTEEHHHNFRNTSEHINNTSFQPERLSSDSNIYVSSDPSTRYASPASGQWSLGQPMDDQHLGLYQRPINDAAAGQEWYGSPSNSQNLSNPDHQHYPPYTVYAGQQLDSGSLPVTPAPSDYSRPSDDGPKAMNTNKLVKSRRNLAQAQTAATGSPRLTRIKKSTKGDKSNIPKLTAPLSELTKSLVDIPVRDMQLWVNRPIDVRMKEKEKRHNSIARPMNSFMLYRSAYAERTKCWCLQNNHQVVSSVSGESWPMEPPEVRERYIEFARVERDNHQRAHPEYKFSPSKPQSSGRKRKTTSTDQEEASGHGETDIEWTPPSNKKAKPRPNKKSGCEAGYPVNSGSNQGEGLSRSPPNLGPGPSPYEVVNAGRPLPTAIGDSGVYAPPYYTSMVNQPSYVPGWDDLRQQQIDRLSGPQANGNGSLISIPGNTHQELLGSDSYPGGLEYHESQVDPSLFGIDQDYEYLTNSIDHQLQALTDGILYDNTPVSQAQPSNALHYVAEPDHWTYNEERLADLEELTELLG